MKKINGETRMLSYDDMLGVVVWAAQECEWQGSGENSVASMVDAYLVALEEHWDMQEIKPRLIMRIGAHVEPRINSPSRFRRLSVMVGNSVKPHWMEVPRLIDQLCFNSDFATPEEWFREFEEIHPFRDGNGRTGAILYNWRRCGRFCLDPSGQLCLLAPRNLLFPPNLWGDPRRE